jgi:hypothetical protein
MNACGCCFEATYFVRTTGTKCSEAVKAYRCIFICFLKASLALNADEPSGPLQVKPVEPLLSSNGVFIA